MAPNEVHVVLLRGNQERLTCSLFGFWEPAQIAVDTAEKIERQTILTVRQLDGLLELNTGFLETPSLRQSMTEIPARISAIWLAFHGLLQVSDALLPEPRASQRRAEIPLRVGMLGIELDGLLELNDGILDGTLARKGFA